MRNQLRGGGRQEEWRYCERRQTEGERTPAGTATLTCFTSAGMVQNPPLRFPTKNFKKKNLPGKCMTTISSSRKKFSFPSSPPLVLRVYLRWVFPLWAQRQQLRRRQPSATQLCQTTRSETEARRKCACVPCKIKARLWDALYKWHLMATFETTRKGLAAMVQDVGQDDLTRKKGLIRFWGYCYFQLTSRRKHTKRLLKI